MRPYEGQVLGSNPRGATKFMATFTKKKSMSKNIGKYVVKKTVTVTKTIKKRK